MIWLPFYKLTNNFPTSQMSSLVSWFVSNVMVITFLFLFLFFLKEEDIWGNEDVLLVQIQNLVKYNQLPLCEVMVCNVQLLLYFIINCYINEKSSWVVLRSISTYTWVLQVTCDIIKDHHLNYCLDIRITFQLDHFSKTINNKN